MQATTKILAPERICHTELTIYSDRDTITVAGPLDSAQLETYRMCEGLDNFRQPYEQHRALIDIAKLPEGQVYVALAGDLIVGYVTFHYPEFDRWARSGIPNLLELGAIEVSKNWRGLGVSKGLISAPFETDLMEDKIIVSMECHYYWDIKGSGMSVWEYRTMMEKLFGKPGFVTKPTDDPDIICHPANILQVRIGSQVEELEVVAFESLLFSNRMFA